MEVDWKGIEAKWRQRWDDNKDFEADPNDKEKKFITVAYPYPNSPQHIGHGRTYTIADVHARYYRMKGFNVLFPMGFHYTGTPILGMARRVEAGDEEIRVCYCDEFFLFIIRICLKVFVVIPSLSPLCFNSFPVYFHSKTLFQNH